nr:pyrroline-5-carboxylate reductase dimerization domain-containing protein [Palleronia pontilimi]
MIGTGDLGAAIATGWLRSGAVAAGDLILLNRSGDWAGAADWPAVAVTTDLVRVERACDTVLLALPPAAMATFRAALPDRLVLSVMAGISLAHLSDASGGARVIRAMSSPAAAAGMAYSPFCPGPSATGADIATAERLLGALGLTDRVGAEDLLDVFTAMTGPVPGFVALFAASMADYATAQGVPEAIAHRAIRQLFAAAGDSLSGSDAPPRAAVDAMIAYAGTTAAGIEAMEAAGLGDVVATGLEAARRKARHMGQDASGGIE